MSRASPSGWYVSKRRDPQGELSLGLTLYRAQEVGMCSAFLGSSHGSSGRLRRTVGIRATGGPAILATTARPVAGSSDPTRARNAASPALVGGNSWCYGAGLTSNSHTSTRYTSWLTKEIRAAAPKVAAPKVAAPKVETAKRSSKNERGLPLQDRPRSAMVPGLGIGPLPQGPVSWLHLPNTRMHHPAPTEPEGSLPPIAFVLVPFVEHDDVGGHPDLQRYFAEGWEVK